ncbi:MAG: LEA type 2 family protein [Myxococcaceae bacterium]|nr:LEA type 2 family protein [Myxococcaceae bacterium]
MRRALLACGALVMLTASGCAFLKQFLSTAFQTPTLAFKSLALRDASFEGIGVDLTWLLNNPNSMGLNLAEVDYAFFVDEKQVVAGSPPRGFQVAANGQSDLLFPVGLKFADIAQVVQTFLTKDTAHYRAQGHLGIDTPLGLIKLPLEKDGDFEVPKLPTVHFENPKVTNVGIQGATLEFPLSIGNRNSFPLPIAQITGGLSIAGSQVGTLSTGNLGALEGKGVKQVTLPLTVSFLGAAGAVVNAVRGGQSQVAFNAQVQSGGIQLPLNLNQAVNFVK